MSFIRLVAFLGFLALLVNCQNWNQFRTKHIHYNPNQRQADQRQTWLNEFRTKFVKRGQPSRNFNSFINAPETDVQRDFPQSILSQQQSGKQGPVWQSLDVKTIYNVDWAAQKVEKCPGVHYKVGLERKGNQPVAGQPNHFETIVEKYRCRELIQ